MGVANFFPEIWAAGILKEREKLMVAAKHCNRDYEGEIKQKGDRVKILTIGDVASYDYTRNADINAPDQLTDEAQWLDIDKAKYCHVAIDDIDQTQANEKLMTEAQRQIALRMADDIDQDIFGLYTQISAAQTIDGYTVDVTSANVINYLATIRQKFKEANVPNSETIYLEVSPAVYTKFVLARIARETMNTNVLNTGETKQLYDIEIVESNNVVYTGGKHKCFARTKAAISFASQLTETVAYRPEKRFGDAVKSLQVWGKKIVRPKELFLFDVELGAEA
jgi:hypothetical protein